MSNTASLQVNGRITEYKEGDFPRTVSDLLAKLALPREMVVAEVNGVIVKRGDFGRHRLLDGDKVEIVRFVGGG